MNPELRRNLWLEITTHRLVAMPIVLGLGVITIAALDNYNPSERVGWMGLVGFVLLTLLWGTRLAANAIFDELTDKTWDWQRLSTLGPWTMTWGKLFGATAFAWYGGLICLAVYLVTARSGLGDSPARFALTLVLLAVLLHAGSIAVALQSARKMPAGGAPSRRSVGVLLFFVLIYLALSTIARRWRFGDSLEWFGYSFEIGDFALASVAAFAAWAVIGAYRTMCQSLAVRTTPWVWMAFLLFLTVYCAGFIASVPGEWVAPRYALLVSGLFWSLLLMYFMLFTEPTGPMVIRRVLQKIKGKEWRRAFEELPCWPLTWIFAAVCAAGLAAPSAANNFPVLRELAMAPIPIVLLALRDAAILLFFSASAKPNRAVGTAVVYILVLSWILPGMLYAVNLKPLARIMLPLGWGDSGEQILSAAVQAGIAGWLAYRRIKANFSSYRQAD